MERQILSEFRQDPVSGEWVLFSTGRSHSIRTFELPENKDGSCAFDDPWTSGNEVIWAHPDRRNWQIVLIQNKYPALQQGVCAPERKDGPTRIHPAAGHHEVIIFREHAKQIDRFSREELEQVVKIYRRRYSEIASEEYEGCKPKYILIFHNKGTAAGASIFHPHSQIISTPILPPDIQHSIRGSHDYYKKYKKRVYDVILDWEIRQNKRIIYENEHFVAFCPYVSKSPYEVRIFSKESHAHFEQMPEERIGDFADALYVVFYKLRIGLNNPAFNFYIHTASLHREFEENFHSFYHWHFEIMPHVSVAAGFELGTGVMINVVDPDEAAQKLRDVRVSD